MRRLAVDVVLAAVASVYGVWVLQTSHAVPPYGANAGAALFVLLGLVAIHQARVVHGGAE
ncbi:hypothetical protein C2R22_05745 [Salinigranum rubrum]|uniref:Uncharacterized protein n=1 Tax=Salinigranum rubrum TaxID=755307 RepID=A0A2I8VH14_9EURY|nr:hypothetical protein [Salinigranum rubrum]AUV81223.1 hypothetical protein C2R22_05745 [Salinigranum rubrum]